MLIKAIWKEHFKTMLPIKLSFSKFNVSSALVNYRKLPIALTFMVILYIMSVTLKSKISKCIQKNIFDFDVLICIQKPMACITSSIDLLYLIKTTSWCSWVIFIKENLILLICPFCFNIRLSNCLQLRERSSILLVVLEILRNFAPMLPQNILLGTSDQ